MDNSNHHIMDRTNKVITTIGVCLESVTAILVILIALVLKNFSFMFPYSSNWDLTQVEYDSLVSAFNTYSYIFIIFAIIVLIIVMINLFLFVRLIRGNFTEQGAKRVYMYQAIYGGLTLFSNQLIGILYLLSGIRGYKGEKEEKDIRFGI